MNKNYLILEKRGCDFSKNDTNIIESDLCNYRLTTLDYDIKAKNGKNYFIEFTHWVKYNYRTINKKTGKELKKAVKELVNNNALCISLQYQKKEKIKAINGDIIDDYIDTYGDIKTSEELHKKNYSYTKKDLLQCVNDISEIKYNDIIFSNDIIKKVNNTMLGYREKNILDNLKTIEPWENNDYYNCFRLIDKDLNYFIYDIKNNKIVG